MHKKIKNHWMLIFLLIAGCKHYLKPDLEISIGREINIHEAYYGQPTNVSSTNEGEIRKYVNSRTGCVYELDVNNTIVTAYRIKSDENLCYLETEFGQK